MFKSGDIVKYRSGSADTFFVRVISLRHDGTFSGTVIKTCARFQTERPVGFIGRDFYAPYFDLVEDHSPVTIEMLRDDIAQLQQENEQLKQRLIEAERNALYWTAFDCPVNRDIAERILRKEN